MAKIIDNKFVFYHFPKTGGQWFSVAMMNAGINIDERYLELNDCHWTKKMILESERYKPFHGSIKELPGVIIRRDPIDWYMSYWNYQKKNEWKGFVASWWSKEVYDYISNDFNQFIDKMYDKHPGLYTRLWNAFMEDFNGYVVNYGQDLVDYMSIILDHFNVKYDFDKFYDTGIVNSTTFEEVKITRSTLSKILMMDSFIGDKVYV